MAEPLGVQGHTGSAPLAAAGPLVNHEEVRSSLTALWRAASGPGALPPDPPPTARCRAPPRPCPVASLTRLQWRVLELADAEVVGKVRAALRLAAKSVKKCAAVRASRKQPVVDALLVIEALPVHQLCAFPEMTDSLIQDITPRIAVVCDSNAELQLCSLPGPEGALCVPAPALQNIPVCVATPRVARDPLPADERELPTPPRLLPVSKTRQCAVSPLLCRCRTAVRAQAR